MTSVFDRQKAACLAGVDLSRKGSIDAPICDLVSYINASGDFFTTSSCSGRIIVVDNTEEAVTKKGCKWVLTSHTEVDHSDVVSSLASVEGTAVLKFEPFIVHIQCRSLDNAQAMLGIAVASGYRNSGISVGNKAKFITAIRSTQSLEVPLTSQGRLLVNEQYIQFLVKMANQKMRDNFQRIERLFTNMKSTLETKQKERTDKRAPRTAAKTHDKQHGHHTPEQPADFEHVEDLVDCAVFCCDLDT